VFMTIAMFIMMGITPVSARQIAYCSNLHTGEDYNPMESPYQSHGLCFDRCKGGDYSFAIVQGQNCWCSDYAPEGDKAECNEQCPGYPSETCGSTTAASFVYLATGKTSSGTTDGITKTTNPSKASSQSKSSTTPEDTTSSHPTLTVITKVGGFQTITVSPTSTSDGSTSETKTSQGSLATPGQLAGLVIGLLILIALIVATLFFWRRHRQRGLQAVYDTETPNSGVIPAGGTGVLGAGGRRRSRSMSTLGLIGEKNGSPTAMKKHGPTANGVTLTETSGPGKPTTVYDPRLDPGQLFMRFDRETGSSRMSVRSLRDDTDYSRRVLQLANPDD